MTLLRFSMRRVGRMVATIVILVPLTFMLFRAVPGDPSAAVVGPDLDPSIAALLRERYGVDQPIGVQFIRYVANLARGDLGISFHYKQSVGDILLNKLFNTAVLAVPAIVLALVLGSALGAVAAATSRRGVTDAVLRNGAFVGRATPIFWTATLALLLFSYRLNWVPSIGMTTPGKGVVNAGLGMFASPDFWWHLALPLLVMTLYFMPEPLLTMRTSMADVLREDFIALGRAQGLSPARIIYRHAARNALLPVVTLMPALTGTIIGGQVIVETIFSWPGMGRAIVDAVNNFDYPMMQGVFLLTAVMAVVVNGVIDVLYAYLDPRVRLA
ncbi:MAG: Oligopeptide transport system permease protein OppB [Sphaerisporangium sp.]|jgi:peptide/nickel transport system permease protein|nr:Oligopeptide transport system permease protein OppB [Sphaerisporangium sp.]